MAEASAEATRAVASSAAPGLGRKRARSATPDENEAEDQGADRAEVQQPASGTEHEGQEQARNKKKVRDAPFACVTHLLERLAHPYTGWVKRTTLALVENAAYRRTITEHHLSRLVLAFRFLSCGQTRRLKGIIGME